ncbi:cytochrome c biogenesis CcdA family protein [Mycobacterium paraintracellulare]|uniref:cytochrome c biogenesis CcdA family protein n=1 Tax=Mycobacterium paraintracellulare TaxID=1138383 RepID=UPI001916AF5E|nr:cytochrome c biogenesis protein CcdA [Mycobacterium paraintracellulare]
MNGLLALALTAGMIAPVNPCGFALLPAWITHTLGDQGPAHVAVRVARAARAALALTLGFTGTLAAAGLAVSAGARALITAAPWLGLVTGVVLLLLGLVMLSGRSLGPHLRLPTTDLHPAGRPTTTRRLVLFGVGYAAASLSCSVGVLLAVIAQAQATTSYAGLLAVFAAYATGSAAVLLLVCTGTAAAGAALTRRLSSLARHGTRITAAVLTVTGAYLAWYWYPAATGHTRGPNILAGFSATTSTWLQAHTTIVLALAAAAVVAVAAALRRHANTRRHAAANPVGPDNNPPQDRPTTTVSGAEPCPDDHGYEPAPDTTNTTRSTT